MSTKTKFLKCAHCGNVVESLYDSGVAIICCGEPMGVLTANTTDAAQEKHVPKLELQVNTFYIQVGDVPHPMTEEHYIEWVELVTDKGVHRWEFKPGDKPATRLTFDILETPIAVYAYCNLHGLWKSEYVNTGGKDLLRQSPAFELSKDNLWKDIAAEKAEKK